MEMSNLKKIKKISCGLLVILLISCGGAGISIPESTTTLTKDQAAELADEIGGDFISSIGLSIAFSSVSGGDDSEEFEDINCPDGEMLVDISGDTSNFSRSSNNAATVDVSLSGRSQESVDCQVDGIDILNPDILWDGDFSVTSNGYIYDGRARGSFEISGSSVSKGLCAIDIKVVQKNDGQGRIITGQVCGVTIDEE